MCANTNIWMHMCKHFGLCRSFSALSCVFALTTANVAGWLITICSNSLSALLPASSCQTPPILPLTQCPPVSDPGELIWQDSVSLFTATHLVIAAGGESRLSSKACDEPPSTPFAYTVALLTEALCSVWWGLYEPQRFYSHCRQFWEEKKNYECLAEMHAGKKTKGVLYVDFSVFLNSFFCLQSAPSDITTQNRTSS